MDEFEMAKKLRTIIFGAEKASGLSADSDQMLVSGFDRAATEKSHAEFQEIVGDFAQHAVSYIRAGPSACGEYVAFEFRDMQGKPFFVSVHISGWQLLLGSMHLATVTASERYMLIHGDAGGPE